MAQQQSSKGNPAAHRMSNDRLKARRAASWARGQERKRKRREEQEERARRNRAIRNTPGQFDAWETARQRRRERRAEQRKAA